MLSSGTAGAVVVSIMGAFQWAAAHESKRTARVRRVRAVNAAIEKRLRGSAA